MRRSAIGVALAAVMTGALAAQPVGQSPASVRVVLTTGFGDIVIETDSARAPVTSANFLRYVDAGLYQNGRFHRAVRPDTETRQDYPIQVVQAGIDPARRREGFPAIALERTRDTGLRHVAGAVSMARSGADTATSDFFISLADLPELDFGGRRNADGQGFAVFGRVVGGLEVARKIQAAPVAAGTQNLAPPVEITAVGRRAPGPAVAPAGLFCYTPCVRPQ